jgi:hypothetical protein
MKQHERFACAVYTRTSTRTQQIIQSPSYQTRLYELCKQRVGLNFLFGLNDTQAFIQVLVPLQSGTFAYK